MNKADIRKYILEKRNSLSRGQVLAAGENIINDIDKLIKKIGSITGNMVILGYMPLGNEVDLRNLFKKILTGYYKKNYNIDIVLGLPRVCENGMKFFEIKSLENLKKSNFGIMEPDITDREIIASNAHVLVPLIGLNKDKQRLGFGAGYYDRYFEDKKNNILYGIAYNFQKDLDFEANEHDIAMDYIFSV